MQEALPQDELLEQRIKALSGMAESAGWNPSITGGLGEMMRLAEKRKQYESTLSSDTEFSDWKRKQDYLITLDKTAQKEADEVNPFKQVSKLYGEKYLTGKTESERAEQAAAIMESPGNTPKEKLSYYLQNAPLTSLLSAKDITARESGTTIMKDASYIASLFQDGDKTRNIQGIGPWGSYRPTRFTNAEGITAKQAITFLTAERMKELSGTAVSDEEVKRLLEALPNKYDKEEQIVTKANNIANIIQIGQTMQEYAKRYDLTLDQAYAQFGAAEYDKLGMTRPKSLVEREDSKMSKDPNAEIEKSNIIKKLKADGYSQADIDEFIKMENL